MHKTEDNQAAKMVAVKRSKAGLGLFAARPFKKGETITEYIGFVLTPSEGSQRNSKYIFAVDETKDIDGSPRWNIARYINHSCRPNAEAEEEGGRVFIRAKRNIMLGEEVSYDYGKEYFDEYIKPTGCRCEKCQREPAPAGALRKTF